MAIIGNTTIGGTTAGPITGDTALGGLVTATFSGTLVRIYAYLNINSVGTAPMRVAIFAKAANNTVGDLIASSSSFVNVTNTSPQWISCNISAFVVQGVDYWLFAWVDPSGIPTSYNMYVTTGAPTNTKMTAFSLSPFGNWAQIGDGANENYQTETLSIYAEVNAGQGTPSFIGVQSITGIQSITI